MNVPLSHKYLDNIILYTQFFQVIFLIITVNIVLSGLGINQLCAQSFDLAVNNYGISFGNSKKFNGFRINLSDREVEEINGVNLTFWRAKNFEEAIVNGVSIGLLRPEAGHLNGIQIGGLGVGAAKEIKGISAGIIGARSVGSISGITLGGLGTYSARNLSGITIGGIGALSIGNITGITLSGLGTVAGGNITGFAFGCLGATCKNKMKGISIGGLGTSAHNITGMTLALLSVNVYDNGSLTGFSASVFNNIKGRQTGVSLGVFNYAYELNGIQIGLINYVRDNSRYKILPIINAHFD